MASDTEIVFEIDEEQFAIKAGCDDSGLPWRFEIVDWD